MTKKTKPRGNAAKRSLAYASQTREAARSGIRIAIVRLPILMSGPKATAVKPTEERLRVADVRLPAADGRFRHRERKRMADSPCRPRGRGPASCPETATAGQAHVTIGNFDREPGEERTLLDSDAPQEARIGALYQPDVARADRAVDAGGDRGSLPHGDPRIRAGDEVGVVFGDQPDGQGAGDPPRRDRGHRGSGDLRLSGRRLPRRRARAAGRGARRLLPLAVLRRRSAGGGGHQPRLRPGPARGQGVDGGVRQFPDRDGGSGTGDRGRGPRRRKRTSPLPMSMSDRMSSGACNSS